MSSVLYSSTRPPGQTGAGTGTTDERAEQSWIDLALIAEARARARRRRRRIALAFAPLVAVVCGLLIAHMVQDVRMEAKPQPTGVSIAPLGYVTGHLRPCAGAPFGRPVTPGMVTVLRGRETWKPTGHGNYQLVLPKTAVAHQYISNNYSQTFMFTLPPGQYVLMGRYKAELPGTVGMMTFTDVTVSVGQIARVDLPDMCP